ncbi:MAG: flagellar biosynthesis protein FlhF [Vallitaleaceae bacterium]|nr:flagellar biosynthesis protein FlhF [Vallitaleaceae bacterium]
MKINKFKGESEKLVMTKVKEELGGDALILSVKNIRPKGVLRLFRKPYVEITAALDDNKSYSGRELPKIELNREAILQNRDRLISSSPIHDRDESEVDEFKNFLEKFSRKQEVPYSEQNKNTSTNILYEEQTQKQVVKETEAELAQVAMTDEEPTMKILYEQLLETDVVETYANTLLQGIFEQEKKEDLQLEQIISVVYNRILKQLSDIYTIPIENSKKIAVFVGPTGVGKTTTIAKLASLHALNYNKKVAFITADTYRIAAVEQLRTYANILNIPIKVVYTKEELHEAIHFFREKDLILIDTAGRSHRNSQHNQELKELLDSVENKEVFLTLSSTMKFKDALKIIHNYKDIVDFNIVFTKLDETENYGNILNIKMATGAKLSYITFGQNVPDDICEMDAHKVARNILGGDVDGSGE